MAFIKIENFVINTDYIVAIQLENQTGSGEKCVSILLANYNLPILQFDASSSNHIHCEWVDFTGNQAIVLQDYFSSFNNVIELMSKH